MSHQLSIKDGAFMSAANGTEPVVLKGVNWFGFNCQYIGMVSALDKNDTTIAVDFKTIVLRMKLLGLNTVRLNFSFQVLNDDPQHYFQGKDRWDRYQTKQVTSLPIDDEVLRSVIPDWKWTQLQQRNRSLSDIRRDTVNPIPQLVWESDRGPTGTANNYPPLNDPTTSVRTKFVWVVEYLARNGFYVIIEDHVGEAAKNDHDDTLMNDFNTANANPSYDHSSCKWVQAWKSLVQEIVNRGAEVQERLIVDLANEPDARKIGNQQTPLIWEALQPFYLAALQAIKDVNPNIMAFVEGTGQNAYTSNWGDGFVTDQATLRSPFTPPLSNPRPFLSEVIKRGFTNLALSPHVYPPSVADSGGQRPRGYFDPVQCEQRWAVSFGDKNSTGFQPDDPNHATQKFAVCIGEVGSLIDGWSNATVPPGRVVNDRAFLSTFKDWLNARKIYNVLWWSWSENSDTGGLVDDEHQDSNNNSRVPDYWSVNWEALKWIESVGPSDQINGVGVPRIRGWYYSL